MIVGYVKLLRNSKFKSSLIHFVHNFDNMLLTDLPMRFYSLTYYSKCIRYYKVLQKHILFSYRFVHIYTYHRQVKTFKIIYFHPLCLFKNFVTSLQIIY